MPNEKPHKLTPEELEEQNGETLPSREAMSVVPVALGDEATAILVDPHSGYTLPVEPPDEV